MSEIANVIVNLRAVIEAFESAANDPKLYTELEKDDADSMKDMLLSDATDYGQILQLVEDGNHADAIIMQHQLDTASRNAIRCQHRPVSECLVNFFH